MRASRRRYVRGVRPSAVRTTVRARVRGRARACARGATIPAPQFLQRVVEKRPMLRMLLGGARSVSRSRCARLPETSAQPVRGCLRRGGVSACVQDFDLAAELDAAGPAPESAALPHVDYSTVSGGEAQAAAGRVCSFLLLTLGCSRYSHRLSPRKPTTCACSSAGRT